MNKYNKKAPFVLFLKEVIEIKNINIKSLNTNRIIAAEIANVSDLVSEFLKL